MTRSELCQMLENRAREYRIDAKKSIKRSKHMHECRERHIKQKVIDAMLVDFINYVALSQCMDLGLYTHHIKEMEQHYNERR